MSAPVIVSTVPASGDVDVILGTTIHVVFDQAIDPATITDGSFALTSPGQTQLVDQEQLELRTPILTGREYITGTFSFPTSSTLVFTPGRALRPNTQYTLLLVGGSSVLALAAIKNPGGDKMASSYQWTFTTGTLNLTAPPVQAPLSWEQTQQNWDRPRLDPQSIIVIPRASTGNDLTTIELRFPGPVDPSSFNLLALFALSVFLLPAQQTAKPVRFTHHDHTPLAGVPVVLSDALLNSACTTGVCGVTVESVWLVNYNASTVVTVTVSCKSTGMIFIKAALPGVTTGGNNIPLQLPADGVWCAGGVGWVASGSGVNGTISGSY